MVERLAYCRAHLDWLRKLVLHEPRGCLGLCAVLVLPAVQDGSDFDIVVLEQTGVTAMSGSNTICVVTAAMAAGLVLVAPDQARREVVIDTAVGTLRAVAELDGGRVRRVNVANVASYVVKLVHPLEVSELRIVPVDTVFGGQFFAQTDVRNVGLTLDPARGRELARARALIKLAASTKIDVHHPESPNVSGVNPVMLHSGDRVANQASHNAVVLPNAPLDANDPRTWTGALDRFPVRDRHFSQHDRVARPWAARYRRRLRPPIIGSELVAHRTASTSIAGKAAVLPTISGRAFVTGRAQWILDELDIFPTGYTLGDILAPQ
jgi:proline racemase